MKFFSNREILCWNLSFLRFQLIVYGPWGLLFLACANDSHTPPLPYQSEGGCSMFLMGISPSISTFE